MIIRKVNIISFAGIKNKVIMFDKGVNLIYGDNEAGKSTIQSFIKIWLYGMSNYKGKDYNLNERLKYFPVDGGGISGELYISVKEKEYIIKRTFGRSKKEDTSIIIDAITGEEASYISKEEPGRYFFNINRSTFINTLFIGQLAVDIKKDKEEEIVDKILNSIGIDEGQVSVDTALSKLKKYKKDISNIRKSGELDLLNEKINNLNNEKFEAYNLSNHNLENEELLIRLNEEKKILNQEINNLDIYKRFLKKSNLKKEFQKINEYFQKKQELKNKENYINKLLTYNDEIINSDCIKDLREEHSLYLAILNSAKEEKIEIDKIEEKIQILKTPLDKYYYVEQLPEDILTILERLKIRREVLKEKVDINKSIEDEIIYLKLKEKEARNIVGNAVLIDDFREEVVNELNEYERNLRELKYIIENNKNNINNKLYNFLIVLTVLSIILGSVINIGQIKLLLYISSIVILIFLIVNIYNSKNRKYENMKIEKTKSCIKKVEKNLDLYCNKLEVNNYEELIKKLKIYNDYVNLKEKILGKINEKLVQKELLNLDKAINEFEDIDNEINNYLEISNISNLELLITKINEYKELLKEIDILQLELRSLKNNLNKTNAQLQMRYNNITRKLSSIGFKNINILDVQELLNELEEKLDLRDEIRNNLISVEETYSALVSNKDIEVIKQEISNIINTDVKYSYKNEEEIDLAIKSKNLRLLEVEKHIKDIENEIKNRFNGKRTITAIEEEIREVESKIFKSKIHMKATDISIELLREAYNDIRGDFGPILNNNVTKSFNTFTDGKYSSVLVSDNYEMKVRNNNDIIQADILSNGANDQLNLSLRLAFIKMIFKNKSIPIYLDDAFIQYDDKRIERVIKYLVNEDFGQCIIFTCQKREESVLARSKVKYKYIKLVN